MVRCSRQAHALVWGRMTEVKPYHSPFKFFTLSCSEWQRIGTIHYSRRAIAYPVAAYFPRRASATAFCRFYTPIIAFFCAFRADALAINAYFAIPTDSTTGCLSQALTKAVSRTTWANALTIAAYFTIRTGSA